jgi:hypothetical protein
MSLKVAVILKGMRCNRLGDETGLVLIRRCTKNLEANQLMFICIDYGKNLRS